MSDPTDPVATLFPLLASKGERPEWLPHDWNEAAWPTEPTREAALQFVDWLLLCFRHDTDSPHRRRQLQEIGSYRNTLRDVRKVVLVLQERGITQIEFPVPPTDTDWELTLDLLQELRVKLSKIPAPTEKPENASGWLPMSALGDVLGVPKHRQGAFRKTIERAAKKGQLFEAIQEVDCPGPNDPKRLYDSGNDDIQSIAKTYQS
jgi:hypothetical protein